MPAQLLKSVFATQPASFEAACSVEDAIRRLDTVVKRSVWQEWASDCLIGSVSGDRVVVRWHRGGTRDFLPATFRGRFAATAGGSVLVGHFQHHPASRVFLTAAVVLVTLFFVASLAFGAMLLVASQPIEGRTLSGMFIAALIAASGLAVWRSNQPLDPQDVDRVTQAVNHALSGAPSNQAHPAGGAPRRR